MSKFSPSSDGGSPQQHPLSSIDGASGTTLSHQQSSIPPLSPEETMVPLRSLSPMDGLGTHSSHSHSLG
jgi:hypothetical protein